MSLYDMMTGYYNPSVVIILPMLGRKASEYPRFRDCYVTEDRNIAIYTRVGGNNRNCGYGEEILYEDPNYLTTYDDDFDSTYGIYEFKVPDIWKEDFENIMSGKYNLVSKKYVDVIKSMYPILAESVKIDELFSQE